MKRIVLVTTFLLFQLLSFVYLPSVAHAETRTEFRDGCSSIGQCIVPQRCVVKYTQNPSANLTIQYVGLADDPNCAETRTEFTESRCTRIGQCVDNKTCVVLSTATQGNITTRYVGLGSTANCGSSSIGSVAVPDSIRLLNLQARIDGNQRNSNSIGIVIFASNLLRLFAIIAGIWAMINFVIGGYTLITSGGDAGAMGKVKEQITMSVIGLSLIAGAYIIAGLIGLFFFGDASFILNPKLEGAV